MKRLLIIFLITSSSLFSQLYYFHYYNSSNGLSNTSITCLSQDNKGYIWIGTTSNVFRYDGYRFEEVSLWNNELRTEISGLAELKNQMWIATSTKGLFVINSNKQIINLNQRLAYLPKKIKVLKKDGGRLLMISENNEFYIAHSDSEVTKILVDALLPQTNFNDIVAIDNGYAIASDEGLIIFQYNRIKYKFSQDNSGKPIRVERLCLDKNNNIVYVTSSGKIYRIENFHPVELHNSTSNYSRFSLLVDRSNSIWAGFDDGVFHIENKRKDFISYSNGLPHQVVTSIFEDREGNIWIGTLNGIAKLNSLAIKNYPSLFPKVTSSIHKILKNDKGFEVFSGEGISIFNSNSLSFSNYSFNSSGIIVNDVIESPLGQKLIGTNNGLYVFQGNKLFLSPLNSQINSRKILSLAKDSENKIYVGTDSGVFIFKGIKLIDYLSIDNILPSNEINSILVTKSGDIFIGTDNGLVKYSEGAVTVLRTGNGLINNHVTSLSEDYDGRIWIGTKRGLSSFKNGRFNNLIPKIGGYTIDQVNDVIPVAQNEVWVATTKGIFIIKNGLEYSSLTARDGLLSDYIKDLEYDKQNGIVFIGTNSGLTIIELKYFKRNTFTYKIYFTGFSTNKRTYDFDNIKISQDENEIKIDVSIFSFYDEKRVIYRYKIKEFEDNWNYLTNSNEIKYKDLSPGKYTLIVEASVDGLNWLKNSSELKFEIQSDFLKHFMLYGSIFFALVFLYVAFLSIGKYIKQRRNPEKIDVASDSDFEKVKISDDKKLQHDDKIEELKKKLEEKVESLTKIILEKEKIIDELREENNSLKKQIDELENSLKLKFEDFDNGTEFVEKSRIEVIVKNSREAEEIKQYISALEKTNWNIRAAAKLLNIPHSTFHYRLKKLNLLRNKRENE